ncbi:uncharacterized protein LOC143290455 [Babylonia areolata]|uniref:uncharacterized protein LOC143290455 n=1 Tax=Babylonia areolata TaxID=304850 RepID=UPI003FD1C971
MVTVREEVSRELDRPVDTLSDDLDPKTEVDFVQIPRESEYALAVHSPRTMQSLQGVYTSYCLDFQSHTPAFRLKKTRVRRRFSEFLWLRKELDKVDSWRKPPPLPPRRFWNLLEKEFVEARQDQLQKWLYTVLSEPNYLSCTALHLFLQTELTTQEIQDYMDGKIPEEKIQQMWTNHGKRYNYQPHNPLHNFVHEEPTEIHFTEEDMNPTDLPIPSITVDFVDDPDLQSAQQPSPHGTPPPPESPSGSEEPLEKSAAQKSKETQLGQEADADGKPTDGKERNPQDELHLLPEAEQDLSSRSQQEGDRRRRGGREAGAGAEVLPETVDQNRSESPEMEVVPSFGQMSTIN